MEFRLDAASVRNLVVDEEWMRLSCWFWLSAFYFLLGFNIVDMVSEKTLAHTKPTPVLFISIEREGTR